MPEEYTPKPDKPAPRAAAAGAPARPGPAASRALPVAGLAAAVLCAAALLLGGPGPGPAPVPDAAGAPEPALAMPAPPPPAASAREAVSPLPVPERAARPPLAWEAAPPAPAPPAPAAAKPWRKPQLQPTGWTYTSPGASGSVPTAAPGAFLPSVSVPLVETHRGAYSARLDRCGGSRCVYEFHNGTARTVAVETIDSTGHRNAFTIPPFGTAPFSLSQKLGPDNRLTAQLEYR